MREEEKKAIKYLKNEIERVNKENNFKKMPKEIVCIPLFLTYSETLLNLIEKLQKENEELREITNGYNSLKKDSEAFGGIPLIIADEKYFNDGVFKESYINKDKIRELINKYEEEAEKVKISYGTGGIYQDIIDTINDLKEILEEE